MKYRIILAAFLCGVVSCSDGIQAVQHINGIIEDRSRDKNKSNDITSIVLIHGSTSTTIPVDSFRTDGQFTMVGDTMINLMWVATITTRDSSIIVQLKR